MSTDGAPPPAAGPRRTVGIVPHTHWDREWYAPFQVFRTRLVGLLDDLLPRLEADPGYAHFLLDGQVAAIDDHLAVRPEAAAPLRRLAAAGRLGVGPWYVLMDEFLVSGETIVRDLQLGLERAAAFGGAMEVGYLPDMFGHIAQMPQLLAQAGFEHAVVWRGVPAAVDRTAFTWEAPDGSSVRAEYLPEGYGNGATLPRRGDELVAMVRRFEQAHADALVGDVLWLNGTDHLAPQPWLADVVAEANATQDEYRFVVRGLAEHLAAAPATGPDGPLPRWRGELRSGARANLLMGVVSNRVDVRVAAAAAERALERLAEPLSALALPAERWPGALLDEAWRAVVLNAAHDSVCACSADDVVDAVLVRYAEARHVGATLAEQAVAALAASVDRAGPLVVNPTARRRGGLVELRFPGDEPCPGTQVLDHDQGVERAGDITRADLPVLVQRALDDHPHLLTAEATVAPDGVLEVALTHDPARRQVRYGGPILADVRALAAADPTGPARFTVSAPPSHRALARVPGVDGFGWAVWEPTELDVAPVVVDGLAAANGLVRVEVDPTTGTFALEELVGARRRCEGLGRLVDGGDAGDTYNHDAPVPDVEVDEPEQVAVRVLEHGPLRARIEVVRRYRWPKRIDDGRRGGEVPVEVATVLELQAGSGLVGVELELDNRCRDHRLRVWFPLPERAPSSHAECAFAVVERGLAAEGGPTERALATYPARRFVAAGGLLVLHDGVHEHELVDLDDPEAPTSAGALALTVLRATGLLSNGPMPSRPLPAGPIVALEGAQVQGRVHLSAGLAFDAPTPGAPRWAHAYALADELELPLLTTRAEGGGPAPASGSGLVVDGVEVSALRRVPGGLEVRVFNPCDREVRARLPGRRGWLVDLRGRGVAPFDGEVAVGPWRIATLLLEEPPSPMA